MCCFTMAFSQEDTIVKTQDMKSVFIVSRIELHYPNPLELKALERKDIQELQPEDLGQLLQKFAGISMKSYGGLGGLKTFSFRSLGSQHTATVLDGFLVQNTQSGQLNLGQIQTSNLESVSLGQQAKSNFTPVSALVLANEIAMSSFESIESFNTQKLRLTVKAGSFGQSDNYLGYHLGKNKFAFTVHGKYRQADGNYPYSLQIGNFNYKGTQQNNQLKELYSGASFFFRPTEMKQAIRLIYRNSFIDQGLPGAVVLYNTTNKQYLTTENHSISLDWNHKWGLTKVRYYSNYQYSNQRYLDSNYLNNIGFLKRSFFQNNGTLGWRFNRDKFGDLFNFYGGIEENYSLLNLTDDTNVLPQRWTTSSSVGLNINEKKYTVDMRLSHQLVVEQKSNDIHLPTRSLFAPFLQIQTKEKGKYRWKTGFTTSTTSRLPSFNELYYAQVGNMDLKPERAQQFVVSNGFSKQAERWTWRNSISLYFNKIENKILTIPTKNLFVWSIQNVGEVHASGADLNLTIIRNFQRFTTVELGANYSLQRSINRTKDDPNNGSQIAYIPLHTANADLTVRRKNTGLRFSSSFIGERYSLNENIATNLLGAIAILDASFFQSIDLHYNRDMKYKQKLNFQFQVKNIFNQNYTYVRSFVMPGRNLLLSLSYAF